MSSKLSNTNPAVKTTAKPVAGRLLCENFIPGQWLDRKQVTVSSFTAIAGTYERTSPVAGSIYSNDVHYFDMRLALRAPDSRGRLADLYVDTQSLGEIIFVPAGHRYMAGGGPGVQRNFFLFLNADFGLDWESTTIDAAPLRPRDCMNLRSEQIKMLLTRICRELFDPGVASKLLLEGLGTTLQAETLRLLHHDRQRELGKGGLSPAHMRKIRETVVEGNSLPSLADIAAICGMSRRHLMRAFRQETGQTVGEYVHQLAMDKARQLLKDTDLPVNAIASRIGFSSAAAFSTAFRRTTGDSPRTYRAIQRASMVSQRHKAAP